MSLKLVVIIVKNNTMEDFCSLHNPNQRLFNRLLILLNKTRKRASFILLLVSMLAILFFSISFQLNAQITTPSKPAIFYMHSTIYSGQFEPNSNDWFVVYDGRNTYSTLLANNVVRDIITVKYNAYCLKQGCINMNLRLNVL